MQAYFIFKTQWFVSAFSHYSHQHATLPLGAKAHGHQPNQQQWAQLSVTAIIHWHHMLDNELDFTGRKNNYMFKQNLFGKRPTVSPRGQAWGDSEQSERGQIWFYTAFLFMCLWYSD